MKRIKISFVALFIALVFCLPVFAGNWVQDNIGWWYQNDDGSYPKSQWFQDDSKWYYFDANGYMAANCWIGDYYLGASGAMLTNTYTPDGKWVDASGKAVEVTYISSTDTYVSGNTKTAAASIASTATGAISYAYAGNNSSTKSTTYTYIGNANSMKFHKPTCASVKKMADHNKVYLESRQDAIDGGYVPCKNCKP